MQEFFNQIWLQLGSYVPNLLGAVTILLVGFLIAWIVSAIVKAALNRTSIDNKLAGFVSEAKPGAKQPDVEATISTTVFYILMAFVAVAFFQALGLTLLVQPLNNMLDKFTQFVPKLLGAAVLLAVAWVIATILKLAVKRLLDGLKLETKLETAPAAGEPARRSIAETVSEVMYWLVFLLFLPAIVDALGMQGALVPLQTMLSKFMGFLPNLFASIIILLLGWFIARVAQRIAARFLAVAGLDTLGEKLGIACALGTRKLSDVVGIVVQAFILLPVTVAALDALGLENVTRPVSGMLNKILAMIPNIFGAFLVLAIAFYIGKAVAAIVVNLLGAVGFNTFLANLGLNRKVEAGEGAGAKTPAHIVGTLVQVSILLMASTEAARLLGFDALGAMIVNVMEFGAHILVGLVVFVIGLYLSNIAASIVAQSSSPHARLLSHLARAAVIVLITAMALRQTNIANEIINLAFGLMLGAIAIAIGLSFGLGGREAAGKVLDGWAEELKKNQTA